MLFDNAIKIIETLIVKKEYVSITEIFTLVKGITHALQKDISITLLVLTATYVK